MNQKNDDYLIPELEIRISQSWVRLVRFCQVEFPHGDLKVRIVNGQPTELVEAKRKIRFDKEQSIPTSFISEMS